MRQAIMAPNVLFKLIGKAINIWERLLSPFTAFKALSQRY